MGHLLRQRFLVYGRVQGVGFRPFVSRLALSLNLKGFIKNTKNCVHIEIEGAKEAINRFTLALSRETPSQAKIDYLINQLNLFSLVGELDIDKLSLINSQLEM